MSLPGLPPWAMAALLALLLASAVLDLKTNQVPPWLTYPAMVVGLAGHALTGGLTGDGGHLGLAGSAVGFAVGFFPLLVFWLAGGLGGGDTKLMGAIGALGGWELAVRAMMCGFIIAALMAIVVMIRKRLVRRTLKRMWHVLVLLVMPGAKPADPTSADSPRIPFAVALCLGTLVVLAEGLWHRAS